MRTLKLVEVIWTDADDASGWQPHDPQSDDVSESELHSYGLLVSKGKQFVTISYCLNLDGHEWLGKHRIPVKFVRKINTIKVINVADW